MRWLSYDSLNIELPDGYLFFPPIVNWGRYPAENGRLMMPLSVRLNHAIADGFLVANVYRLLEKEMAVFSIKRWGQMKIEHIAMYVNDLEGTRDFFVKYLGGLSNDGYHNELTGFRSYFITFDDGARLEIMNKPSMEDSAKRVNRTGYIHIAFSVGSAEEVDRLTRVFREDGYEVINGPRTTGDGYYESCIIGVEGNQIEITA